jgi:2-polyprenyl-6-methoxyphenol hydroxylase-like FAD-dependent oxidoreductase
MPVAVIAGGSIAGLAAALALNGIGYRVHVVERGDEPPPRRAGEAAPDRPRPTAPQALHSHTLTSLGLRVLRERAPRVLAAARDAGAHLLDLTLAMPAGATDAAREPGDDELAALGCRRPTLERALHDTVRNLPGVTLHHRTTVAALELDAARRAVRAVRTTAGGRLPADIVVDATGRTAAHRAWLRDAGTPPPEDRSEPSGLRGHTRVYRLLSATAPGPLNRGNAAGDIWDHYAGVLHPGDGDTFSIALATLPGDHDLNALRTAAGFTAAARATPGLGPWLADGVSRPLSPVRAITAPPNTLRAAALAPRPPVTGLYPLGDAACTTNPLFGRGMSLALEHAFRLADLLAAHPRPGEHAAHDAALLTGTLFLPWYEHSAAADRARIARWRAAADGAAPPPEPPPAGPPGPAALAAAAATDGVVWRALTRTLMTLATPAQALGDDKILARIRQAPPPARRPQAPPRAELVRLVTEAAGARP